MKGKFLITKSSPKNIRANIFADRSGLLLHHLLCHPGAEFQIRETARQIGLSHSLVQRVISALLDTGIVTYQGIRTAKRYSLANPTKLLNDWLEQYSIVDRCRFFNYSSGYSPDEIEGRIQNWKLCEKSNVVLALHSAARRHQCSFTNLNTVELYCPTKEIRLALEKLLRLDPIERGYDVLLIEPYYSAIVAKESTTIEQLRVSSPLLTFLDLYHFPLRGKEQAEYMIKTHEILKPRFLSLPRQEASF